MIAAAELAARAVIDVALGRKLLPATLAEVRAPQPESPFDQLGFVKSMAASGQRSA